MDAGRQIRKFPGYTTKQLKERLANMPRKTSDDAMLCLAIADEIERRESGFYPDVATPQIKAP